MFEIESKLKLGGTFEIECYDSNHQLRWKTTTKNGVTTAALNNLLDVYFGASDQTTSWKMGLIKSGAVLSSSDTMASHPGWVEFVGYTGVRPTWSPGAAIANSVVNSTPVQFEFASAGNISGIFLSSDQVRGGTDGVLWATATIDMQSVRDRDILLVTYRIGASL